jgi:hypothetical protein
MLACLAQLLCAKVGDLPVKRIPCRLRVVGSPLQLHKQRVLLPGSTCLRSHTPGGTPPTASSSSSSSLGAVEGCRLLLDLGQVLPQQRMTETFYVTNNGEHNQQPQHHHICLWRNLLAAM